MSRKNFHFTKATLKQHRGNDVVTLSPSQVSQGLLPEATSPGSLEETRSRQGLEGIFWVPGAMQEVSMNTLFLSEKIWYGVWSFFKDSSKHPFGTPCDCMVGTRDMFVDSQVPSLWNFWFLIDVLEVSADSETLAKSIEGHLVATLWCPLFDTSGPFQAVPSSALLPFALPNSLGFRPRLESGSAVDDELAKLKGKKARLRTEGMGPGMFVVWFTQQLKVLVTSVARFFKFALVSFLCQAGWMVIFAVVLCCLSHCTREPGNFRTWSIWFSHRSPIWKSCPWHPKKEHGCSKKAGAGQPRFGKRNVLN